MRLRLIPLALLAVVLVPAADVLAKGGPGPGKPIWPKRGQTDAQLYEKAMRIQARMWWHLSPEGLLAEIHLVDADAARLSHDVIQLSDAAIWTGCYAAAQACRWRVTRDPDALAQVRHLAKGLATLSDVTGVRGRFARSAGRALPGERRHPGAVRSPTGSGLYFRPDVSRDQLAGVTLGWATIYREVDDPELRAMAGKYMSDLALRLSFDDMWLRDYRGQKTEHGELRRSVQGLPFVKNGGFAAIGFATVAAGAELSPGNRRNRQVLLVLDSKKWDDAVSEQQTFFSFGRSPSNLNMFALSLLTLARGRHGNGAHRARLGLHALRKSTTGWWNAGICACCLWGNPEFDRRRIVGEIRATLHAMPEQERPPARSESWSGGGITPIQGRSIVSGWTWKEGMDRQHVWPKGVPPHPRRTHTRADWLFAYWLTRAAGALQPRAGPGAHPTGHRCPVDYPPWMQGPGGAETPSFGARSIPGR